MTRGRWIAAAGLMLAASASCAQAAANETGRFVRTVWAKTSGNRFRVNSPDTKTGRYKDRREARQTGRMALHIDEDLSQAASAELYLELWGGHPGVANKRFVLNGKGTYRLPEVGAAAKNCTYSYPTVPLKLAELIRGENVLAFTCDRGGAFWGHYLIRAACVRLGLKPGGPALRRAGLASFSTRVAVRASGGGAEAVELSVPVAPDVAKRIARVEYWGRYAGYDENGDGRFDDWHGFTKDRKPAGILGTATDPPFALRWDLSMVPPAAKLAARARVHWRDAPGIVYETPAAQAAFPARRGRRVALYTSKDLPRPFWSRAGRAMKCTINLDVAPAKIERAELHVVIWDGGKGATPEPFTLNGRALAVAGGGRHDVLYRIVPVDPRLLRRGANEVRVLSDTKHHGIEVVLPGPALMVRSRPD